MRGMNIYNPDMKRTPHLFLEFHGSDGVAEQVETFTPLPKNMGDRICNGPPAPKTAPVCGRPAMMPITRPRRLSPGPKVMRRIAVFDRQVGGGDPSGADRRGIRTCRADPRAVGDEFSLVILIRPDDEAELKAANDLAGLLNLMSIEQRHNDRRARRRSWQKKYMTAEHEDSYALMGVIKKASTRRIS